MLPSRPKKVQFVAPPEEEEPELSDLLEEVLEGPEPAIEAGPAKKRTEAAIPAVSVEEAENAPPKEENSTPKEQEKHKSYQRISKLKDLLLRNPGWRSLWKTLLPEELLATNEAWQKDLLENLKAKNVKVNIQQMSELDSGGGPAMEAEYHQSEDPRYYSVNLQDTTQLPLGSVVVHDLVEQLFNHTGYTGPYQMPRTNVASESADLRTLWPTIGGAGKKESLLDSGSQIVSMSLKAALELGVPFDPSFSITMESADKGQTKTVGLARNLAFDFGGIVYFLQVHIIRDPAYEVLLGRPFDVVSSINTSVLRDGGVVATITDPSNGKRLTLPTYKRGQMPRYQQQPGTGPVFPEHSRN